MEDVETRSQWSHLLGRAMAGELEGAELEALPAEMTDWQSWKARHPETDVLDMPRTARDFVRQDLEQPDRFTLGLKVGGVSVDYPFDALRTAKVVNDTAGKTGVVVTFDTAAAAARAFDRSIDGKKLTFEIADADEDAESSDSDGAPDTVPAAVPGLRMRDRETGSVWRAASGVCESGAFAGKALKMLPAIPSYIKAWRVFYPASRTFEE